jgi:aminoglycoside 6-adenylyltransferase
MQNTAKGILRGELPYAMKMLDYSRQCLEKIIECNIGIWHDFKVTAGKFGKYYKNYLSKEQFADYLATFPKADSESIWQVVFMMCRIFPPYAKSAAQKLGFGYRADYEKNMGAYLKMMKEKFDGNKVS